MIKFKIQPSPKARLLFWAAVVLLLFLTALLAPMFMKHDPYLVALSQVNKAPSTEYPMGTDYLGRCILCRLVKGAARSIFAAVFVVVCTFIIGTTMGILCGYFGGAVDSILMRLVDAVLAFPSLVFTVAVAGMLGGGMVNCMIAMVLVGWTGYARMARSQVLSVKERTFVAAARVAGASTTSILFRTVLPNILNPLIVSASMHVGNTILGFAGLSYIGLGTSPPYPEWGTMLNDAKAKMQQAPWGVLFPGLAILLVVMLMGMFGDSLNEVLNPKSGYYKKREREGINMKKITQRICTMALCLAMCATSLTGCASKKAEEQTKASANESFELNIVSANNTHGISLDPAAEYCGSRNGSIGVCETLLVLNNETQELENYLTKEYSQVDDCTWSFVLRDDINFSNGKKMTAESVKASIEYITASIDRLATMLDIKSMEAEGQTLTITTNAPVAIFPRILTDAGMIIFDVDGSENYEQGVVGTGPFILESMDAEGNCELYRNDGYWQGMPAASKVHTKFISDNEAITNALQSGEIDFANVPVSDVSLFENSEDYTVMPYDTGRVYFLYVNPNYTVTKDPALREALQYAFDKEAYLNGVYDGRGKTTSTIFPEWSGYSDEAVAAQPKYNLEKAKQILKDSGYADADGDGFLEKNGEKAFIAITCYKNNGFSVLSEAIQASLKEIGIDSKITVSDSIVADLTEGNFNIATYGYNTLNMGDCFNFLKPVFKTGDSSNFVKFSSENVDTLLEQLSAQADTQARKELAIQIQKSIYEANSHVFLLHINTYKVARAGVENVETGMGNSFYLWKVTK